MSKTSPEQSALRFFGFRWAYVLLAVILWFVLLSLVFIPGHEEQYWWSPSFLFSWLWPGAEASAFNLHGVFGFVVSDSGLDLSSRFGPSHVNDAIDEGIALLIPLFVILLLAATSAGYAIPKSGRASHFPAVRTIPFRGQVSAAMHCGLYMTAMIATLIDVAAIDIDSFFARLGWINNPAATSGWSYYSYHLGPYEPEWGLATPITWMSVLGLFAVTGFLSWLCIRKMTLGRDRYWQAERWTMLFLVMAIALILLSGMGLFMSADTTHSYFSIEQYLGGSYTGWMVGWYMLVFAWTSRTVLFLMIRKYDLAIGDPTEPVCGACGYSLRGLIPEKSLRCPECGQSVKTKLLEAMIRESRKDDQDTVVDHAVSRSTTR